MSRLDDLYREAEYMLEEYDDLFLDVFYACENERDFDYPSPEKMEFFDEWIKDNHLEDDFANAFKDSFDKNDNYYTWWHDLAENSLVSFDYPSDYYSEVTDGMIYTALVDCCVNHNIVVDDDEFNSLIRAIRNEKKMMKESKSKTVMRKSLKESVVDSYMDTALAHQDLYKPMSRFFNKLTELENDIENIDEDLYVDLNNLHTTFSTTYDKLNEKIDEVEKVLLNKR